MTKEQAKKIRSIFCNKIPQEELYTPQTEELATEFDNAIEKQIPKKPKILTWQLLIDSGWKHGCPNCGCAVGVNKNLGFAYEEYLEPNESYCCSCGQALDWSDTE